MTVATGGHAGVVDPLGDYLPTYTGTRAGDLDLLDAGVVFDGTTFHLSSLSNGAIGTSPGSLFVWGINRGAGTGRLALGTPSIGADVLWDAVAVLFPDGSGRVATFPAIGAPTITPLFGAITVAGASISADVPLALLASRGFLPADYTFTLWSRKRVDPAVDGTNAEIADFSSIGIRVVPEPIEAALVAAGLVAAGLASRRRRARGR